MTQLDLRAGFIMFIKAAVGVKMKIVELPCVERDCLIFQVMAAWDFD